MRFPFFLSLLVLLTQSCVAFRASLQRRRPEYDVLSKQSALHSTAAPADTTMSSSDLVRQLVDDSMNLSFSPQFTIGEADLSFRQGIILEKNGQARASASAFHEAATLYQCCLDNPEFAHVTTLSPDEVTSILAYTCVRLAHLNHDALGDARASMRLYKQASLIDPNPSAVALDGVGTALEAATAGQNLEQAVEAYRKAHSLNPKNHNVLFHMAVALERLDKDSEEAAELTETLRRGEAEAACLVDSWGYVRWHTRKIPCRDLNVHRGTRDMLQVALDAAAPLIQAGGLVCEFGVASGRSLRMTQELLPLDIPIHGFDTFTGLPQAWGKEPKGAFSTGGIVPLLEGSVVFHRGLFADTIPRFLKECDKNTFLAYGNIDCNMYSSTLDILEAMHGRIVPGTILVFDEYLGHPTWRQDEFRAWRECLKRFGWQYEYLGFSLSTKQAVVRVTDS